MRDRFLADALHQIAIGGQDIGVVVDDFAELGGEHAFGERHADRRREPLPQRPGSRFDAERVAVFGMPRGLRAELAERLEIGDREALLAADAGEIEQRIEQHRTVPGRQHEPIAIGPMGIGGVEFQHVAEQHGRDVGGAHRQAGMAALGLLDRVADEKSIALAIESCARPGSSCALSFAASTPLRRGGAAARLYRGG